MNRNQLLAPETDPEPPSEVTDSDKMTVMEIDGYGYIGYLSIPALSLELPVLSTATEEMIASDWELSLHTCTYGGRSRVTVRLKRCLQ